MKNLLSAPVIIIACTILFSSGCVDQSVNPVKGEVFLENIAKGGRFTLTGEWEFYPGGFYLDGDFNRPEIVSKKKYIDFNTNRDDAVIDGQKIPEYGYNTYRLKIILPQDIKHHLFLRIPKFDIPVNIYCNSRIIFSNGKVGTDAESSKITYNYPYIAEAYPENGVIELVIHASNFDFPRGGIRYSIVIGSRDSILNFNDIIISVEMIIIGCLLIMGLYNLILYLLIRNKPLILYFSAVCFASAIHIIVNGTSFPGKPGLSWDLVMKVHHLSWIISAYFFYRYFMEMFEKFNYRIIRLFLTFSTVVICILILAAPAAVFNYLYYPVMVIFLFVIMYSLVVSIIEFRRKKENSALFLFSLVFIFILMRIDSFPYLAINQINAAVPAGTVLFCIIQSVIIAKDIFYQYYANSRLSIELQMKNSQLIGLNNNLDMILAQKTEELTLQNSIITANNKIVTSNNYELKNRIEKASEELNQKDDMIMLQSRQASMGEMMGFIVHQWKQNIYAISLYTEAMKNILMHKGSLNINTAKEPLDKIDSFIIEMYNNLNDFTDFVKPKKDVEYFSITKVVEETLRLMRDVISINSIEIIRDYKDELSVAGFSNELKQVVMNIVKNAIDVFGERNSKDRIIVISIHRNDEWNIININDNAGGIPLDNPDDVFEKFYTSKAEGTGLGLYLSRLVIEQRFGGKIEVHNTAGGASFTISIPVFTEDTVL